MSSLFGKPHDQSTSEKERVVSRSQAREHSRIAHMCIFRPVQKSSQERPKATVVRKRDGAIYTLQMFEQLGGSDQLVLLTLYRMASFSNLRQVGPSEKHRLPGIGDPSTSLNLRGEFQGLDTIKIELNMHELLQELGKKASGQAYKRYESSIQRLSQTILTYEDKDVKSSTSLISYTYFKKEKRYEITINPVTAFVVLGGTKEAYVGYDLDTYGKLSSELELVIFGILSGSLNRGRGSIQLLKLARKVYGVEPSTEQIRSVREAIRSMDRKINWDLRIERRGEKSMVYYGV